MRPHGHQRSEAAEQAATRVCDRGDTQRIGTPKFDACMRARGWRLTNFDSSPPDFSPPPSYDSGPPPGPDPSQQISEDSAAAGQAAANDASRQVNDAAVAAAMHDTIYNTPN